MENEILLSVEGMRGAKCEDRITRELASRLPGVELVQVNSRKGRVSVTGGDLDQLEIIDIIESMGYNMIR